MLVRTQASADLEFLGTIGHGAFGEISKARRKDTGRVVAIKKIRLKSADAIPKGAFREMETLRLLDSHVNVVKLHRVIPHGIGIYLELDFVPYDLEKVLERFAAEPGSFPLSGSKAFMEMLLHALAFCHSKNIMHRDIKPSNLLVTQNGVLKLADFGLARVFAADKYTYSHQVATRWYRAPELLYGSRSYDPAVDLWAAGCVLGEMLNGSPLFPGESDIEQMYKVFSRLGSPSPTVWPEMAALPDFDKIMFPNLQRQKNTELWPFADNMSREFCSMFLLYNPGKRPDPRKALEHEWFFTGVLPRRLVM